MQPIENIIAMTKGSNTGLETRSLKARLSWPPRLGAPDVDISALLLTNNGKVSSDDDFLFYNQPRHSSQSVSHDGKYTSESLIHDSLILELGNLPSQFDKIIIAGSSDGGTFGAISGLTLTLTDLKTGVTLIEFRINDASDETAFIFGEIYQRSGQWKFRAVGQGYENGLAGLAGDFGISVEDSEEEPTPAAEIQQARVQVASAMAGQIKPGWYTDPNADAIRWWTGVEWSAETIPNRWPDPDACARCGTPPRKKIFKRVEPGCRVCELQIESYLQRWADKVSHILDQEGPGGKAWESLWVDLTFERIDPSAGQQAVRGPALRYLERCVSFAFADGEIEESEMSSFEAAVNAIGLQDPAVDALFMRMKEGRSLTEIRAGKLPHLASTSLHLDSDETLYLSTKAAYVKTLASGPKEVPGRLIATSKKLRFVAAEGAGSWELPWAKVVSAESEYGRLVLASTAAKGGGKYIVSKSDQAAAVLVGAIRVSKRLVLAPGERDTRSIPQHLKTAVWQRDGGRCAECQASEYLEFDHIIPHSKGGATSLTNLQLLCRKCNQTKGAKI